jgi:DnaJ-class molecular chaperone
MEEDVCTVCDGEGEIHFRLPPHIPRVRVCSACRGSGVKKFKTGMTIPELEEEDDVYE